MKLLCFIAVLTALSLSANAQTANQVVIGKIDSLQSKILNEKRKFWVYVPISSRDTVYTKRRYPVVYLLDGEDHFTTVAGMNQYLSACRMNPEMIVVGIHNTKRDRDLTPTPPADILMKRFMPTAGGGEAFTSFLETELMPYINTQYSTRPYNVLIGHSLGGLMVINTLIHHPKLFNAFICVDPSMWWDNQKQLNEAKQALASQNYSGKSLYLGLANLLPPGMSLQQARMDTTQRTQSMRCNLALMDALETNKQNGLRYAGKHYPDDDHGSVPLITEYDAFRFTFGHFAISPDFKQITESDTLMADRFLTHFADFFRQIGFQYLMSERWVDDAARDILSIGNPKYAERIAKHAESLFKLNIANYPKSYHAYKAYGDYLAVRKDTTNAIINFQKSIALKETPATRKKLVALQQPKSTKN